MKRHIRVLSVMVAMLVIASALGSWVMAQGSDNDLDHGQVLATLRDNDDSRAPEAVVPDMYRPAASAALLTASTSTVYFTPQDGNASCTVMFLYNTSTAVANVGIQTYRMDGEEYLYTTVAIPAKSMVRICSDEVTSTLLSWETPVIVNFKVFSAYGKLVLPSGVKVEAFVAWNGVDNSYDPEVPVPVLPMRFSTDPASVFLPTVQKE